MQCMKILVFKYSILHKNSKILRFMIFFWKNVNMKLSLIMAAFLTSHLKQMRKFLLTLSRRVWRITDHIQNYYS